MDKKLLSRVQAGGRRCREEGSALASALRVEQGHDVFAKRVVRELLGDRLHQVSDARLMVDVCYRLYRLEDIFKRRWTASVQELIGHPFDLSALLYGHQPSRDPI